LISTIPDILARIVAKKREELSDPAPLEKWEREAEARLAGRRDFQAALCARTPAIIAEVKKASPSKGILAPDFDPVRTAAAYQRGGAAALSVLTDSTHFGGSLEDLSAAREACGLPILRKDFIVDPYQLYEAAVYGADAVLLIVRALEDRELRDLYEEAGRLDLDCLVEVHDGEELERALRMDVDVIGINNRNLDQGTVDVATTFELMPDVPAGKTVVAESGISTRGAMDELERVGVDAVLIGEALMGAADPEALARELSGADGETREHDLP
jgi:indole-3-glycerol phosphate synthase